MVFRSTRRALSCPARAIFRLESYDHDGLAGTFVQDLKPSNDRSHVVKIRHLYFSVVSLIGFSVVPSAFAATAVGTMPVIATVISACAVSASVLNFGTSIDPTTAILPVDATSTMSVTCTATTAYTIALDAGLNAAGATNFSARAIKFGANTIGYQVYTAAGRTTVWGDGTASTSTVGGTGNGLLQTLTVYGRLPALSGAVPGIYTDTVTITITY